MQAIEQYSAWLNSAGADGNVLNDRDTAHLVADGQRLLSRQTIPGVTMQIEQQAESTTARICIAENRQVLKPIHLCFGLLQRTGEQHFSIEIKLEAGARVHFIAHGLFANAEILRHSMDKRIDIGAGADMRFTDGHIHGLSAGIDVKTTGQVTVARKGRYAADFSLTSGLVGRLDLNETVLAEDYAMVELSSRVFGHADDLININETVSLNGKFSRGMIKSRVALEDDARAEVFGTTEGRAEGARGHMDCLEIIKDRAVGQSTPLVKVCHPQAKITHEAAIGTVDKKQMETLIAHGLSPEQATDMIVLGMLR